MKDGSRVHWQAAHRLKSAEKCLQDIKSYSDQCKDGGEAKADPCGNGVLSGRFEAVPYREKKMNRRYYPEQGRN